ncbi:MAG: hypothetical protein D6705_04630 [Deltaproteobacteria bacterium]|nr:MAG: hypothetical protein D6705_04630 [Deltaproteobacteria bacterium]
MPVARLRRAILAGASATAIATSLSACRRPAPCAKDTDCKGARICEAGRCVDPKPATTHDAPAQDEPKAGPPPMTPGAWVRGGPGGMPPAARGPHLRPHVAWTVSLGSVVFARAALARPSADAPLRAYVGTHAGRFVAVVAEGAEAGRIAFSTQLGGMIWGTAAVVEGRVYVGADDDVLYVLDADSGEVVARHRLGTCEGVRKPGPEGARCDVDGGPTVAPDGTLYVGADGLYRLAPDGRILWHHPPPPERAPHVFSTPLVTEDAVYVGTQGRGLWALAHDGSLRFAFAVAADVDGSPAWHPDGFVVFGADDGAVYAVDPAGKQRFRYLTDRDVRSAVTVASSGNIYVTSFDGRLHVLAPDGDLLWTLSTGGPIMASPILDAADVAFFGSQDDHLYAVTPDGTVAWALDLGADVDASVAITDGGTLVVGADDGVLRGIVEAGGP